VKDERATIGIGHGVALQPGDRSSHSVGYERDELDKRWDFSGLVRNRYAIRNGSFR
jgi:hypothetical protein